ncbi:CAAX metallo endopeptidase [Cardiosporidium cionae]|uniref:CAAX prenyl protease n=1 Tax=Cardiosporidium cionae TaxID=476202 RepID=A0ABQ7J5F0_9APIC|nr:CAAX metallo endopeptidase [Cardiosporidium cionae]|eukprot:KAF8819149.1 CAAX metallo endopeptidase [Cardiosporidium cionae]
MAAFMSSLLPSWVLSFLPSSSKPVSFLDRVPWMLFYITSWIILSSFDHYLNYRQRKRCSNTKRPPKLENIVSEENFAQASCYEKDKLTFGIATGILKEIFSFFCLYFFVDAFLWKTSKGLCYFHSEYLASIIFCGIKFVGQTFLGLPFKLYGDFVLEAKHGFNRKTVAVFVKDFIFSLLLMAAFTPPIICAIIWSVRSSSNRVYVTLWITVNIIQIVMIFIYPNLIAPLFNKFEPIQNEELGKKINDLALKLNFPLGKLYQIDGSKRSSHSNAYFFGLFGCKQIVIFDTLLHRPHDEILAILCHEMGHWKRNHFIKQYVLNSAFLLFFFVSFSFVMDNKSLYQSFGFFDDQAVIIGIILFGNVFELFMTIYSICVVNLTRKFEYEADHFAHSCGRGKDLAAALANLQLDNKSHYDPDWMYSWFNYTHPTFLERLRYIEFLSTEKKAL